MCSLGNFALQARGHWFDPSCAHPEVFTFHQDPCSRLGPTFSAAGGAGADRLEVILCVTRRGVWRGLSAWISDLPRAFRTAELQLIHAESCFSRYSSWTCCGLRY